MATHKRDASYYMLCGLNLHEEMTRIIGLEVFRGGRIEQTTTMYGRPPELVVRPLRASAKRVPYYGYANYFDWRITIISNLAWLTPSHVRDTLVHELCHLEVPYESGGKHGPKWKALYERALVEAQAMWNAERAEAAALPRLSAEKWIEAVTRERGCWEDWLAWSASKDGRRESWGHA
jgi:hypothetical protein